MRGNNAGSRNQWDTSVFGKLSCPMLETERFYTFRRRASEHDTMASQDPCEFTVLAEEPCRPSVSVFARTMLLAVPTITWKHNVDPMKLADLCNLLAGPHIVVSLGPSPALCINEVFLTYSDKLERRSRSTESPHPPCEHVWMCLGKIVSPLQVLGAVRLPLAHSPSSSA